VMKSRKRLLAELEAEAVSQLSPEAKVEWYRDKAERVVIRATLRAAQSRAERDLSIRNDTSEDEG